MSSLATSSVEQIMRGRVIMKRRVTLYFPFGVNGAENILKEWKSGKHTLEEILLDRVVEVLRSRYSYTLKDIEMVKKKDNLEGQVKMWLDKNRRMLSLGQGGVYKTLIFEISPRMVEEGVST